MKTPTGWKSVLFAALAWFAVTPILSAQTWSADQQAVWKNVQAYWALDAAGDVDGFLSYFDADYTGWHVGDPLPSNRERAQKFIRFDKASSKTLLYDIQPVSIKIYGDIAVVHYYWTTVSQRGDEKPERSAGRWTDVLKKSGDKWLLIADHGGAIRGD